MGLLISSDVRFGSSPILNSSSKLSSLSSAGAAIVSESGSPLSKSIESASAKESEFSQVLGALFIKSEEKVSLSADFLDLRFFDFLSGAISGVSGSSAGKSEASKTSSAFSGAKTSDSSSIKETSVSDDGSVQPLVSSTASSLVSSVAATASSAACVSVCAGSSFSIESVSKAVSTSAGADSFGTGIAVASEAAGEGACGAVSGAGAKNGVVKIGCGTVFSIIVVLGRFCKALIRFLLLISCDSFSAAEITDDSSWACREATSR